jgi:pimeloyl-ACP methyl ester carboxylesterase
MPVALDIYYYTFQGGDLDTPPVVLIHGAGGNHLYWPPEVRRLAGHRIFAPDLPGHGKSEGRGQQSISAYARQILDWLEGLGMSQAIFIGHSLGSAIALSLAISYPENVTGLGLLGAGARLRVRPDILSDSANPTTFHKAVASITEAAFSPSTDPRLVEMAAKRMADTRPSVLHGDFTACNEFDMIERVGEINQPTLLLCGSEDQLTPLRNSQFLAGAIPNAILEVIPGAGHMVMLEKPKEVASSLEKFLAKFLPAKA